VEAVSTREDCPKCGGVQTLNVMEGLLEMQRYCTSCGLDETAPVTATEPLPWSRPDADPVADLFAFAAAAKTHYYELGRRHESDPPIQPGEGRWQDLVSEHAPQPAIDLAITHVQRAARAMARKTGETVEAWRSAQGRVPLRTPPTVREDRSQAARWQRRRFRDEQALNRHRGITLLYGPVRFEQSTQDGDLYRMRFTQTVGVGVGGRHV
jgi:hypothetical protein